MNRVSKTLIAAMATVGIVAGGATIASANSGTADGDPDIPITGEALTQATAAALAETGGGEVTETEIENEGDTAYEVEITMADGTMLEVELDASFNVLGVEDETNEGPDND